MTTSIVPGMLVTPSVRLLRLLGTGGMGSVWAAAHERLGTEVAVKLIRPDILPSTRSAARFAREASLAARIRSPHVVKVFDHGLMDDGTPYIVMEVLRGESLAERLGRGRRLEPRLVGLLVTQAAAALEAAHALGVVHRDVKPANIFLEDSAYELFVKILDFGIAKDTERIGSASLTETGGIIGTPFYMSPEQLLSPKQVDARADLWGLAVVAYHALTGRLPFSGATVAALAVAIREGPPPPPSSIVASLPGELDVWFRVALHRELSLRFADAPCFADSFDRAVRGLSPLGFEGDPIERRLAPLARRSDQGLEPPATASTVPSPVRSIDADADEPVGPSVQPASPIEAAAKADPSSGETTASCRMGADPLGEGAARSRSAPALDAHGALFGPPVEAGVASGPAVQGALEGASGTAAAGALDSTLRVESGLGRARGFAAGDDRSGPARRPAVSERANLPRARAAWLLAGVAALLAAGLFVRHAVLEVEPRGAEGGRAPAVAGAVEQEVAALPATPAGSVGVPNGEARGSPSASGEPAAALASSSRSVASSPSVAASRSSPPARGSVPVRPTGSLPLAAPRSAGSASPATAPDCSQPFVVDEHGDLRPRRECLQ